MYIPLKPPPLGRFWRNFGASWGRNAALGSVLGANLRQVGVKIWLLGHLRGEDSPRGRQGTSSELPGQKSPYACGPFWPDNCNFHLRFGVPFWDVFLLILGPIFESLLGRRQGRSGSNLVSKNGARGAPRGAQEQPRRGRSRKRSQIKNMCFA